ncbi:uncharacterized protein [Haliotis asinina]|uniref:uncharacterized protein n=1 Tax=Haliotis asinina TaxID=109174 RepID=UPI0035323800
MTKFKCLLWFLTWTSLICFCTSQDSIGSIIQRLDQFQEEMLANKVDMIRLDKKVVNGIDVAKTSLRAELMENIQQEVRKAMANFLQGDSLQDMIKRQIVYEVQHLKQNYHQMERQLRHVSKSFRDFQNKTTMFQESLLKEANVLNQENSSDVCVREKHSLEIELEKADATIANLQADIKRITALKDACQSQMSKMTTNVIASSSTPAPLNVTSTSRTSVSTTTPRPQEKKARILLSPLGSYTQHQFRQLNLHSNSLTVYPYHTMTDVTSLAYIAKTNKLLIGLGNPGKIVSSTLDTSHVTVLKQPVRAHGMAVDEDRDAVFIATYSPRYSISRMSTQGENFTAIIYIIYGSNPKQLTLDTTRRRIYWCDSDKLYTVTYDGQGMTTLASGSQVHGVTLDQTAGVLYYSVQRKLMKMTVSNNMAAELTTLNAVPYNLALYRGTVFYSGYYPTSVGAVEVTNNTVAYTLQSVGVKGYDIYCMCLIP